MGFFSVLGSILSGKPADFTEHPEPKSNAALTTNNNQNNQQPFGTPRDAQGLKILPEIRIERVETKILNGHMECMGILRNESPYRMELTALLLLGATKRLDGAGLDNFLDPHEEQELLLYQGPVPTTDSLHDCELHYRNDSGDYFNAQHYVNFTIQPDNTTYAIDTIELVPPIRDIYE